MEMDISQSSRVMWTKNISDLPDFSHEFLEKHLVSDAGIDRQPKGAGRHKKLGYQLFKSGYVNGVAVKPRVTMGDEDYFLVRGRVNAQMKKCEYNVYVHFKQRSGQISYARCECPAGKGGCCKHVAALLFQMLDYKELELEEVPDAMSCTEKLQTWNVPAGHESTGAVLFEELLFEHASYERDRTGRKRPLVRGKREDYKAAPSFAEKVKKEDLQRLRDGLVKCYEKSPLVSVLDDHECNPFDYDNYHDTLPSKIKLVTKKNALSCLSSESVRDHIVNNLDNSLDLSHLSQSEQTCLSSKNIQVDLNQLQEIERNTRGQTDCPEWFVERNKRLTSSNFGSVINRRESIHPKSIIDRVKNSSLSSKIPKSCKWGKESEENALLKYYDSKQCEDNPVEVCRSVGFVVNPKWPWLGASPDALVYSSVEPFPYGAAEIKSPSSKNNKTIREACQDPNFCLKYLDGKPSLKQKHI